MVDLTTPSSLSAQRPDQAPNLVWLPRDLPQRVRLIASTLPGRSFNETARRGWQTLKLAPLQHDERERPIIDYLANMPRCLGDCIRP
jgi:hypothetical protein